jgi:catechol 2,3-dioxygenase-like lactoylglutathione lyase family enzyme
MRLDHVALATRDVTKPLTELVGRLGGTVLSGGEWVGFRPMQVLLGDETGGMKVELLEPWAVDQNDFLERFLTRHGEGPHHLTFKVDDLESSLDQLSAAGLTAVSVDLSQPEWREAFFLPRDVHGTVVQLADSTMPTGLPLDEYRSATTDGVFGAPRWWPDPPAPTTDGARLRRVVVRTHDLDGARSVFGDLFQGELTEPATDRGFELEWIGGGCLRFEPAGDGPDGIDRLELDGPADELEVAGARFVVRPRS